jgi:hypothetical protein
MELNRRYWGYTVLVVPLSEQYQLLRAIHPLCRCGMIESERGKSKFIFLDEGLRQKGSLSDCSLTSGSIVRGIPIERTIVGALEDRYETIHTSL